MENFFEKLSQAEPSHMIALGLVVVFLWFLPALVAAFLNRKHFKLILIACVPAGFSLIAWSGLMVWASTGKIVDKYRSKTEETKA